MVIRFLQLICNLGNPAIPVGPVAFRPTIARGLALSVMYGSKYCCCIKQQFQCQEQLIHITVWYLMVSREMEFHSNKIYDVFLTVQCNRRLRDRDGCIRSPSSGRGWRGVKRPGRLPREGGGWSSLRWSRRSILQPATRLSLQNWSAASTYDKVRDILIGQEREWLGEKRMKSGVEL